MTDSKNPQQPEEAPSNDLKALQKHVEDNPLAYVGAIGFIVACVVFALLFRMNTEFSNRDAAAVYAEALDAETAADRVSALDLAMEDVGPYAPLALYMKGEAAYESRDYDVARAAFDQLREEHADFEFIPDAVEGLGFVLEDEGNLAGALSRYQEIVSTWPDSFAGRRQALNIGRVQEKLGEMEAAVAAYKDQLIVFPGSNVAMRAQVELNRLRSSHPGLFADENEVPKMVTDVESALETINLDVTEQ